MGALTRPIIVSQLLSLTHQDPSVFHTDDRYEQTNKHRTKQSCEETWAMWSRGYCGHLKNKLKNKNKNKTSALIAVIKLSFADHLLRYCYDSVRFGLLNTFIMNLKSYLL